MKKMPSFILLLVSLLLLACDSSEEGDADAQATQVAAAIFATQTAAAPDLQATQIAAQIFATQTAEATGPAEGAREWIDGIVNQDGNKVLKHTCLAQREALQQASMWLSAFSVLAQLFTTPSVQIKGDVSDLKFETLSQNGDQAEVRVHGELRVAVLGSAQAQQVDERWPMVWENETWRWCGSGTGVPALAPTNTPVQPIAQVTPTSEAVPTPTVVFTDADVPSSLQEKIVFLAAKEDTFETYIMNPDGTGLCRLADYQFTVGDLRDILASNPAWSPDGRRIAFVSDHDGNPEIYVVNIDGSGLARLTNHLAADATPSWSPDGQRIAFMSERDGNPEIYVMNADGSGLIRLTNHPYSDAMPSWSVDGQKIVFSSEGRDGPSLASKIYVMNADGSGLTRLTNPSNDDMWPTWSPDGQKIAFITERPPTFDLYVMDADGGDSIRLTEDVLPMSLVWSPDGQNIAVGSDKAPEGIRVMNVDSGDLTDVPDPITSLNIPMAWYSSAVPELREGIVVLQDENSGLGFYLISPDGRNLACLGRSYWAPEPGTYSLSPDGQWIVIAAGGRFYKRNLYKMKADGSDIVLLTENSDEMYVFPAWSPDGEHIAFTSVRDADIDIYVMNTDGSDLTRLTNTPSVMELSPTWLRGSEQIAFISVLGTPDDFKKMNFDFEVHVINTDGSGLTRLTDTLIKIDNLGSPFFTISPDGQHIAFVRRLDPTKYDGVSYVMSLDGTNQMRQIGPESKLAYYFSPVWSSDGQQFAFLVQKSNDSQIETYIINVDGSGLTRLGEGVPIGWLSR